MNSPVGSHSRVVPFSTLCALALVLVYFLFTAGRALGEAEVVQPAEPWMPTPDFTRARSQEIPAELILWPSSMAGQQPLRSLSIQFDNPSRYQGPVLLTVRNADNSASVLPISGGDVRDNDYVAFPMDGKTPVSATLTTSGSDSVSVIGVSGADVDTATCAIYELMDGTKLTPLGCS